MVGLSCMGNGLGLGTAADGNATDDADILVVAHLMQDFGAKSGSQSKADSHVAGTWVAIDVFYACCGAIFWRHTPGIRVIFGQWTRDVVSVPAGRSIGIIGRHWHWCAGLAPVKQKRGRAYGPTGAIARSADAYRR